MKAELKAKDSADPYFLAAILAAMQGNDPDLYKAIHDSALKLSVRHHIANSKRNEEITGGNGK
jgi:hypothetical protein